MQHLSNPNNVVPRISASDASSLGNNEPQHILNLAVLINLFDQKSLTQLAGDSQFLTPPKIDIPEYKFYENDIVNSFVEDAGNKINLKKASNALKEDQVLIKNLGQALVLGRIESETNFFITVPGILMEVLAVITVFLLLNNLYLTFKVKQILITLAILQNRITTSDSSDNVLSLNYFQNSAKVQNNSARFLQDVKTNDAISILNCTLSFIVVITIALFACAYLFKRYTRTKMYGSVAIFLEFKSNMTSKLIKWADIFVGTDKLHVMADQYITNIRIVGRFQKTLKFDCNSLIIKSVPTGINFPMISSIQISWRDAKILHNILSKSFSVKLVTFNQNYLIELQTTPIELNDISPTVNIYPIDQTNESKNDTIGAEYTNSANVNQATKIYPTLSKAQKIF